MPLQPESRASGGHIAPLDGVRAVAILLVIVHHFFHVPILWLGVDIFFVLSGFLITGVLMKHRTESFRRYIGLFYARRVRRIWPAYLLALLVTTLVFGTAWLRHAYMYIFLMNFVAPLHMANNVGNEPFWSLAVEEQFYLVWPFAVYYLAPRRLAWLAAGLIVTAPVLRALCTPVLQPAVIYAMTPMRMDLLAMGALLAILWRERRDMLVRFGRRFGLVVFASGCALLALLAKLHDTTLSDTVSANVFLYEGTLLIATGMMLHALGGRWVGLLTLRPLRYIAKISYSLYLINMTAIVVAGNVLWKVFGKDAHATLPPGLVLLAAVLTGLYAAASWHWLEQPILRAGASQGH